MFELQAVWPPACSPVGVYELPPARIESTRARALFLHANQQLTSTGSVISAWPCLSGRRPVLYYWPKSVLRSSSFPLKVRLTVGTENKGFFKGKQIYQARKKT